VFTLREIEMMGGGGDMTDVERFGRESGDAADAENLYL
jgi:hypothetical protein